MNEEIKIVTLEDLKAMHERQEEVNKASYLKHVVEHLFSDVFHDKVYKDFTLEQMKSIFEGTIHTESIPKELLPKYLRLAKRVKVSSSKEELLTNLCEELF